MCEGNQYHYKPTKIYLVFVSLRKRIYSFPIDNYVQLIKLFLDRLDKKGGECAVATGSEAFISWAK